MALSPGLASWATQNIQPASSLLGQYAATQTSEAGIPASIWDRLVSMQEQELERSRQMDAFGMLGGGLSQFVSGLDQVGGDYLTDFVIPPGRNIQLGQVNNPGLSLLMALLAPAMRGGY